MEPAADPGINMLSTSQLHQDASLVKLANSILGQLHVSQKIASYAQINGSLFVTMYEGLCGEILPDAVRTPESMDDDIHNAQSVIDALALEVLHTSLSHISGDAVARGDRTAVGNLLDLFSSLMEFILNRIECDLSDEEGDDPDKLTSDLIEEILAREMGGVDLRDKENYDADEEYDRTDDSGKEKGRNSTLELIRESEEVERRLREQEERRQREIDIRLEQERIGFEKEESRRRVLGEERIRDEKSRRKEEKKLVEEALARYGEKPTTTLDLSDDSSVGVGVSNAPPMFESTTYDVRSESPSDFTTPSKGQYSSLLSLTEETCELSRSAVRNSPARAKAQRTAFLEAAIKSALKKIDREAKGVENLVGEVAKKKKSVRMKLSDEFNVNFPRNSSPVRAPYQAKPLSENNNNTDEGVPRPSITISSPGKSPAGKSPASKSPVRAKKSAKVKPFNKRATTAEKSDQLKRLYAFDYRSVLEDQQATCDKERRLADAVERDMRKNLTKSSRKSREPVADRTRVRGRQKCASYSPPKRSAQDDVPKDSDLFYMLDAFPNLYLSTDTMHDLWRQSVKQIEQLNKIERETKRKDVLHKQLESAARRQNMVSEIFRKDIEHRRRMADIKERQAQKKAVKLSIQEKRSQSARIRRYYQDFQLGMRSKMLNKRIRDELIFKKVFKDGLAVQRQCIRDMRQYAKEQCEKKSTTQQNQIESLENFYRDQFLMLAEATQKERADLATRQKAQNRVINRMKRELRHKMESEIRNIQTELVDEEDGHFRKLDADNLHQDLLLSKYKVYD